MVVVLDIEVLRALVGDYKTVVIRKNSIKCYGFHDKVYDAKDILDIGLPKREDIKKDIVSDFLRSDIIAWQPHPNNSDVDIIIRNDGKVLEIEKTLLSSYNNEIKANHCRCRNGFRNNKHCVSANFKHLLKNQIGSFRNFRYKFEQH